MYTDGKKDATLTISKNNDKWYRDVKLEEHYVIIGEAGEFYLSHTTLNSEKELILLHLLMKKLRMLR